MISTPVRTTGAITQGKNFTSLALSFTAPTAGNLLITALSVDKTVSNPVAPSGFTIGGTWNGTAGTGLVWAYKLAAAGTETSLTWGWSNSAGAAAVYAEFPTVSATFVSGVVNGTESNVTSLSATAPAPGSSGGLHVGFAAVDSAGPGISPATWPVPGGPSWSGQTQVALQFGNINPDNGASSVAMAAAQATSGATKPTTMSYSGQADQNALAVGTFNATERGAAPPPQASGSGAWSFTGASSGKHNPAASGSGTWTTTGTATGKRSPVATGAGAWTFTGTATGQRAPKATAAGSSTWTGAATGRRTPAATASGTWSWSGTASGKQTPAASGAEQWTFTGQATGKRTPKATGAGAWAFIGQATGYQQPRSYGAGLWTWAGTAVGFAPIIAPPGHLPGSATLVDAAGAATLAGGGPGVSLLADPGAATSAVTAVLATAELVATGGTALLEPATATAVLVDAAGAATIDLT